MSDAALARHRRGWLTVALIFSLGVGVGMAGTTVAGLAWMRRLVREAPGEGRGLAERTAARVGAEVQRKLDLDPTRMAAVQRALDASAERMRAIRAEAMVDVAEELHRSTAEVAQLLPEEKRVAWFELVAWRFERLGLEPPPLMGPNSEVGRETATTPPR